MVQTWPYLYALTILWWTNCNIYFSRQKDMEFMVRLWETTADRTYRNAIRNDPVSVIRNCIHLPLILWWLSPATSKQIYPRRNPSFLPRRRAPRTLVSICHSVRPQKCCLRGMHYLPRIRTSHTRCSKTLTDLLCSGVGRDFREERICVFGALCNTEGGRMDIERLWADLRVGWIIADEHDHGHMTGL